MRAAGVQLVGQTLAGACPGLEGPDGWAGPAEDPALRATCPMATAEETAAAWIPGTTAAWIPGTGSARRAAAEEALLAAHHQQRMQRESLPCHYPLQTNVHNMN